MLTTTFHDVNRSVTSGGDLLPRTPNELTARYEALLSSKQVSWTNYQRLLKLLGEGGQGVVYLTERREADGFTLPVAIKIFAPDRYDNSRDYDEAMVRMARVAARVAQMQQDNLLDVHNFLDRNRIRMMVMEWIDGYDLKQLLIPGMLERIRGRVSVKRWEYINRVLVTAGPAQPRIKAGVAVSIVRECLSALQALHRENIIHGDIKPANIMLKLTGNSKIVDIGSAYDLDDPPPMRACTPAYAAPEVLENRDASPRSDLASLGYVLIELLAGRPLFHGAKTTRELLELKRSLPQRLPSILPEEVTVNSLLMNFCRTLIAPDPTMRFPSAEAADLVKEGAAAFLKQLVMGDLSAEYKNEIRLWLVELRELEGVDGSGGLQETSA